MAGHVSDKTLSEEAKTRLIEKSAKEKVAAKAKSIIAKHFNEAIAAKEDEVTNINAAILEAQTSLHLLRYGAVSKTYAAFKASAASISSHDSIHPEVKSLVAGKRPKTTRSTTAETAPPANALVSLRVKEEPQDGEVAAAAEGGVSAEDLPGYVAPLAKKIDVTDVMAEPRSGLQPKAKRRFVIGNVSKWIECSEREDSSTHKWMLYVRGCKELPDVSDVVKKVRFFIHQTYAPNNVIDVSQKPFHLIRRGWGEFPARVQIHFKNPANKPVDVVHNLKLDKTYTGLQTLGSETLIDVWLKTGLTAEPAKPTNSDSQTQQHLEQNFTIVEDKSLLATADSVVVSINSKQLKRTASAVEGDSSECKKPRLSNDSNVLKAVHPIVTPKPSVGASLLKKIH